MVAGEPVQTRGRGAWVLVGLQPCYGRCGRSPGHGQRRRLATALQDTTSQSIFAGGRPRAGWNGAAIPPQRWTELLPQCWCLQAAHVGFQLGTGLSKSQAPWGKHVRIHLGLFGEREGRLIPKAGRAEGFLLPPQRVSRRIPWEELHFPTTTSHEPGLLGAQGGGKELPRSPRKPDTVLAGPWGMVTALPGHLAQHWLADATALPSHVLPLPGSHSPRRRVLLNQENQSRLSADGQSGAGGSEGGEAGAGVGETQRRSRGTPGARGKAAELCGGRGFGRRRPARICLPSPEGLGDSPC